MAKTTLRTSEELEALYKQAKEKIKAGSPVMTTLQDIGLDYSVYRVRAMRDGMIKKTGTRAQPRKTYNPSYWRERKRISRERNFKPLTVTEIQPTPTMGNKLMAVIGSPAEIGEFLRSYS